MVWIGDPYNFNVPEKSLAGYQIGRIQAQSTTSSTETIVYTLGDDPHEIVDLNESTGFLTLRKNITDVVTSTGLNEFCVTCYAFLQGTSFNTQIGVGIYARSDHNNHAPSFNGTQYNASVSEDAVTGTVVLVVSASDLDSGDEGRVTYHITNTDDGVFSITNDTGNITVNSSLDYEQQTAYNLTVVAQDHGPLSQKSSSTHVYVTVLDVNDNSPSFNKPVYLVNISEGVPIGSVVLAVSATDYDAGVNSLLNYSISGGSGSGVFQINDLSGVVSTRVSLDFDTRRNYQLNLSASDSGIPRLTDTAIVDINVINVSIEGIY